MSMALPIAKMSYMAKMFSCGGLFNADGRRSDELVNGCIAPFEVCKNAMFMSMFGNNILPFTSSNTTEGYSGRALLMQNEDKLYIVGLALGRERGVK